MDSETKSLILGPFHGKPAVVRIEYSKGVCGTSAAEEATQLVPDVHAIENHIACDSNSQSEVVIPLFDTSGTFTGVLDMDSPRVNGFGKFVCL